jgi:hypothetical protein
MIRHKNGYLLQKRSVEIPRFVEYCLELMIQVRGRQNNASFETVDDFNSLEHQHMICDAYARPNHGNGDSLTHPDFHSVFLSDPHIS